VSLWKVILATLVIFVAGLGTGMLLDQRLGTLRPSSVAPAPFPQRLDLMARMNRQLDLTPAQRESIEQIFRESRERIRKLRETVEPKVKDETRVVREHIRQVLTPAQIRKFDELMEQRSRLHGPEGNRKGWREKNRVPALPPADAKPSGP